MGDLFSGPAVVMFYAGMLAGACWMHAYLRWKVARRPSRDVSGGASGEGES